MNWSGFRCLRSNCVVTTPMELHQMPLAKSEVSTFVPSPVLSRASRAMSMPDSSVELVAMSPKAYVGRKGKLPFSCQSASGPERSQKAVLSKPGSAADGPLGP